MADKLETIKVGGAEYAKVATRLRRLHEDYKECQIETSCEFKEGFVLFTAKVTTGKGTFTGHSFDKLGGRAKQFEKLESISVGRALGFAGYLAGGEVATYEEITDLPGVSVAQLNSLKLKFAKMNEDDLEGLDRAQQQQAFNGWARGVIGEDVNYLDLDSWQKDWFALCWRELTGATDDVPFEAE